MINIIFYKEYFADMLNRIPELNDFEFGTMKQVLSNKIRSTAEFPLLFLERYTGSPNGENLDNLYEKKYGALVIVDTVSARNTDDADLLLIDAKTEELTKKVRECMIEDKKAHILNLRGLKVSSLNMNYIPELFGGAGWRLSFEFDDSESMFVDEFVVLPSALQNQADVKLKQTIAVGNTVIEHNLKSNLFNVSAQDSNGKNINLNVIARTENNFTIQSYKEYDNVSIILIAARAII